MGTVDGKRCSPRPSSSHSISFRRRCMLLAGDIGGTKTVLAVFSPEAGAHAPLAEATFPSGRYGRLEAIVREFLAQTSLPIDRACFGVAGPVVAGTAQITNLPW